MENFDRVTRRRFEEYNEGIIKNRQKYKIEKELTEKLSTLQTDISTNDIPTCVCEKSVADKVEKTFFFGCGGILCTAVPGWSIICSIGFYAFVNSNAMEAVVKADIAKVLNELKEITVLDTLFEDKLASLVTVERYACPNAPNQAIMVSKESVCSVAGLQRAACGSTRFFNQNEIAPKIHGAIVEGIAVVKDAATKTRNTAFSSPFFFFLILS
ncbi:rifin [Plasmodium falciparum IGH-CR14]|uniref:Rifin n=1 Tax=Plasmodium falciparum IGH-CR14 TaxID=580059 RepID=A0A0L1I3P3_PLAFA|nr:rifin [Plasmodium falciparum IGH-CR14]